MFAILTALIIAVSPTLAPTIEPTLTPAPPPAGGQNITETIAGEGNRLEKIISERQLAPINISNFIQYGVRHAVKNGVPVNTLVLLLLFPLVVAMIAAARHLIGLRGFGIFTPAVTAVAFLSTGLLIGLALFASILIIATGARMLIHKLKLQYLPRMSLLIWFMSLGILAALLSTPAWGNIKMVAAIGIFPILLMILLTETFISAQISHGLKTAVNMTLETLVLASVGYLIMNTEFTQSWVLTHPEVTIVGLAGINVAIGKFTGLRALEMWRFRDLLRK